MDFIAIDFETANQKNDSPCSIGITLVKNGVIIDSKSYLINPEAAFSSYNIDIHGITPDMVKNSPTFLQLWQKIYYLFKHYPIVAHNASFDIGVLRKVAHKYSIMLPPFTYFCTLQLLKCNYPNFESYSLSSVCSVCGFDLDNHCCGSDSLAAAQIMLMMLNDERTHIYAYADKPKLDFDQNYSVYKIDVPDFSSNEPVSVEYAGDGDGDGDDEDEDEDEKPSAFQPQHTSHSNFRAMYETPDYKESIVIYDEVETIIFEGSKFVITGDFKGFSRSEIIEHITIKGGIVVSAVSKQTNYVIVAFQNINVVKDANGAKSTKIIKAEEHRANGAGLKIISDEVFMSFLGVQYG